ncbi:TPA: hypothetical protein ACQ3WD_003201 [Clostridium perfringens]
MCRIHMLLKFGTKEHMEMLRAGKVFFGTRKLYNEISSNGNDNIGDKYEGVFPSKNCSIQLIDPKTKQLIVKGMGTLVQSDDRVDNIPFFSCTYLSDDNINENNNIVFEDNFKECFMNEEGWDYVLTINPVEFLKRIRNKLNGINVLAKTINYSDYDYLEGRRDKAMSENIKNVLLWKDIKYSFQKEFRIILENKDIDNDNKFILDIGEISDISYLFTKEEWFNLDLSIKIE